MKQGHSHNAQNAILTRDTDMYQHVDQHVLVEQ
jgi:5'-3' exonuclease